MANPTTAVNVKDVGAVGDGVADDTLAIQFALDVFNHVYIPPGEYLVDSGSLVYRSGQRISGEGYTSHIIQGPSAAGLNLFEPATSGPAYVQTDDVLFERLRLTGQNSSSAVTDGNGIFFGGAATTSSSLSVRDCHFESFGANHGGTGSGCGINFYLRCEGISVTGCTFAGGAGTGDASDIAVYSTSGYAIISGNICDGANSQGIYVNPVAAVGKISVIGNIVRNKLRHGMVLAYGSNSHLDTVAIGNVCYNCGWTGIYSYPAGSGSGGNVVISGNVVDACGGDTTGSSNGLTAGILVGGELPAVVTSNYVYNAGKDSAGSARGGLGIGIKTSVASDVLVQANFIGSATSRGISAEGDFAHLTVKENTIHESGDTNIYIEGGASGGVQATNLLSLQILGNKVLAKTTDAHGIRILYLVSLKNAMISNNVVVGTKSGTTKRGIVLDNFSTSGWPGKAAGLISDNVVQNWDQGIYFQDKIAYDIGQYLTVQNNRIQDCTVGIVGNWGAGTTYAFLLGTTFENNTNAIDATSATYLLNAQSLYPKRVFQLAAAPTTGTWSVGDTIFNSNPAVGSPLGWMYSAGAWKPMPNL